MSKEKKINHFSYLVLKHEVLKGHLSWKVSAVAKEARVSRAWVYKYHGSKKSEILYNAVRNVMEDSFLLSEERRELIKKKGLATAFLKSRENVSETPEALIFYYMHFERKTIYGKLIREIEAKYFKDHLMVRNGFSNQFQGYLLRCLTHGLGSAVFLNEQQTKQMIQFVVSADLNAWLRGIPDHFKDLEVTPP